LDREQRIFLCVNGIGPAGTGFHGKESFLLSQFAPGPAADKPLYLLLDKEVMLFFVAETPVIYH